MIQYIYISGIIYNNNINIERPSIIITRYIDDRRQEAESATTTKNLEHICLLFIFFRNLYSSPNFQLILIILSIMIIIIIETLFNVCFMMRIIIIIICVKIERACSMLPNFDSIFVYIFIIRTKSLANVYEYIQTYIECEVYMFRANTIAIINYESS